MQERILEMFERHKGEYVSGEQLSRELGCSRTAVWKQIENLRAQGYVFEALSRRGYRLVYAPAKLNIDLLKQKLNTKTMGGQITFYDEVSSTNTIAHEFVRQGATEGTLIIAESQTAGRGRMGKKWHSPKGTGIWMSLVLKPRIPIYFTPQLTLLTAVALCRSIKRVTGTDINIKWPNDLLIGGKKVCGILLESSAEDERLKYVVCGVGVSANLQPHDFPPELQSVATSLAIESGRTVEREELIAEFLKQFEDLYELYYTQGFGPIRTLWEALSITLNKPVTIRTPQGIIEGIASTLDESGALVVTGQDGKVIRVYSGDNEANL